MKKNIDYVKVAYAEWLANESEYYEEEKVDCEESFREFLRENDVYALLTYKQKRMLADVVRWWCIEDGCKKRYTIDELLDMLADDDREEDVLANILYKD